MFKLAPEGYPFVFFFALVTFFTAILGKIWMVIIPFILLLYMCFFFRDPERITPQGRGLIYSPADGKIISIRETEEDELLHKRAIEVSIFMSPLDVHINRSPCDGVVKSVEYFPGRFFSAFKQKASLLNEHITMVLETEHGEIAVRQVAGFLARRAVCRVRPGDRLRQGQRYGIIKFGSRLDIFMPLNTQIKVRLNERVRAGESILGIIEM
jgi:phosphatidylserine decarboxylase